MLKVNEPVLRQACKARTQSTKEDWFEWYRRVSIEVIRQSPDPSIRHVVEVRGVRGEGLVGWLL
jgi:FKBP12-rapamycin complex-associated protein